MLSRNCDLGLALAYPTGPSNRPTERPNSSTPARQLPWLLSILHGAFSRAAGRCRRGNRPAEPPPALPADCVMVRRIPSAYRQGHHVVIGGTDGEAHRASARRSRQSSGAESESLSVRACDGVDSDYRLESIGGPASGDVFRSALINWQHIWCRLAAQRQSWTAHPSRKTYRSVCSGYGSVLARRTSARLQDSRAGR